MEYDNDRVVKGVHKTELYCWIFFVLLNPLVNSLAIFPRQQTAWISLILVSLFISPLYIIYSRVIVPKFLYTGKHFLFGFLTILFFLVVIGLVFLLNGLMLFFRPGCGAILLCIFNGQSGPGRQLGFHKYFSGLIHRISEKKSE